MRHVRIRGGSLLQLQNLIELPLSVQSVMGTPASKELTSSWLSAQHSSQCSKDRMRKDSSWYKLRSIKAPSQSRVWQLLKKEKRFKRGDTKLTVGCQCTAASIQGIEWEKNYKVPLPMFPTPKSYICLFFYSCPGWIMEYTVCALNCNVHLICMCVVWRIQHASRSDLATAIYAQFLLQIPECFETWLSSRNRAASG